MSQTHNMPAVDAGPIAGLADAVILAAGVSRRLGGSNGNRPKILLDFAGETLLARHLRLLARAGLARVAIVVGYEAEHIRQAVRHAPPGLAVTLVENPDYREGSVVSLHAAGSALACGRPVLLMDGDVLYDARLMDRLTASAHPNCLLLDRELEPGDEPVKLCIRGGAIVDFRKRPTEPHDWHGESVGFFRFGPEAAAELAGRCAAYVASGRRGMEYEEPIRDMMQDSPPGRFAFEDITGLPWTEIDFPEDVAKATALLPELAA